MIEELDLLVSCSENDEWVNVIRHLIVGRACFYK
jgi:hypothetical protein